MVIWGKKHPIFSMPPECKYFYIKKSIYKKILILDTVCIMRVQCSMALKTIDHLPEAFLEIESKKNKL